MRLIDADMLTETLNDVILNDTTCPIHIAATVEQYIDYAPTVDAEPVRHGKWAEKMYGCLLYSECSICNAKVAFHVDFKYCPNCGAKMDGGSYENNTDDNP